MERKIRGTWDDPTMTDHVLSDPLLFGGLTNDDDARFYQDLGDYEAVQKVFQELLELYNEKGFGMSMVLFDDALEHLVRVHRVFGMHRGHVLLVGTGGSGKHSVARLASYAAGCETFEIVLSRGYNAVSFREDLKKLYFQAGVEDQKTVLLFSDSNIIDESFLEDINNILTTGMVPTLFSDEEKDEIVGSCRKAAIKSGHDMTKYVGRE